MEIKNWIYEEFPEYTEKNRRRSQNFDYKK